MCVLHCCAHPEYSRGWAVPARVLAWGLWYEIPHDITFTQDLMHTEIMGGMRGRGLWPTQEMFETLGKTLQGFLSHWRGTKCILSRLTKNVSHFCSLSLWYPDIFQAEEFSLEYSSRVSYSVGLCLHEPVWESGGRGVTQELFDWHMDFGSIFHSMPYWMMAFWNIMPFFFFFWFPDSHLTFCLGCIMPFRNHSFPGCFFWWPCWQATLHLFVTACV